MVDHIGYHYQKSFSKLLLWVMNISQK